MNPAARTDNARKPPFAADFPEDPALDALVHAFVRGDYARVRRGASRLAAQSGDERVRRAALELRARTEADPLATALLVLATALLVLLSAWWIAHAGAGGPP